MVHHLRIARPVSDLAKTRDLYLRGLDLKVLGEFTDHEGFDGIMLGERGAGYHFEFTWCRHHRIKPSPTPEDLIEFYVPELED